MGKIKKILENELVGGTQSTDVYPVTSTKAVYDENNERLDNILNRVESGIIYDVSAHNNNAVFESLQVLLSSDNLNTLIPTSVRHGGMSIRFIQGSVSSSDNKYAQYRLMAQNFATDVTQWQGVDDEPTVGSDNLVKSGGVANKLAELELEITNLKNSGWLFGGVPTELDFMPDRSDNSRLFYLLTVPGTYINIIDGDIPVKVSKGEVWIAFRRNLESKSYGFKVLFIYASRDEYKTLLNKVNRIASQFELVWCESSAEDVKKIINIDNFPKTSEEAQGLRFIVRFRNNNTAENVKLQVNNGFVSNLFYNGNLVNSNNSWDAGQRVEIYYDMNSGGYLARPYYWYENELSQRTNTAPNSVAVYNAIEKAKSDSNNFTKEFAGVGEELDFYKDTNGYLSELNPIYTESNDYTGKLFDVSQIESVQLSPTFFGDTYTTFAFLTSDNLIDGENAPFVNGDLHTTPLKESKVIDVPDTAKYLWVYAIRGGRIVTPKVRQIVTPDESISKLKESLKKEEFIDDIFAGVILDSSNDENRYNAMKQLLDVATGKGVNFTLADKAIIAKLPKYSTAIFQKHPLDIIFSKNEVVSTLPASTTKVWSLAVGLDYIKDIKEVITINSADVESGSGFDIQAGDTCTIEALMFGMMIPSSNTCANAFARIAGEKIYKLSHPDSSPTPLQAKTAFIDEMNAKGTRIGFVNSNFDTPSGQSPTNMSCAIDLLRVIFEACSYSEILKCWGKTEYDVVLGGSNPRTIHLNRAESDARDLLETQYYNYGQKTGALYYDDKSAHALVMIAGLKH